MPEDTIVSRIFIAIKIYPDQLFEDHFLKIRNSLKNESIRWVKKGNLHVTIRFIGDISKEEIPLLSEKLKEIAFKSRLFQLKIKGLGVFRSLSYPRVLWAGIEPSAELLTIHEKTDKKLKSIGLVSDGGSYSPHITLGRMKKISEKKIFNDLISEYKELELLVQPIESIVLYESKMQPEGPEYLPISEHFFL